jgi:hypothetical protein
MASRREHLSKCLVPGGVGALVIAGLLVPIAALAPIEPKDTSITSSAAGGVPSVRPRPQDVKALQEMISNRTEPLIRPAQSIAAVKDDGRAKKLAERLKLQGVVEMNGELVAYIAVDKGSAVSVRKGATLLDFEVATIDARTVTLSLEGVQVVLGQ